MDHYIDTLLDDEAVDEDSSLNRTELAEHSGADPGADPHANLPVYRTIHR